MRVWFMRLPIRLKLYAIVLLSCAFALLLATLSSFFIQQHHIHKQLQSEIQTLAAIVSKNSQAGIVFEDRKTLQSILASLEAQKSITVGQIYGANGQLYAEYVRGAKEPRPVNGKARKNEDVGLQFGSSFGELNQSILLDDERIGHLFLEVDLSRVRKNIVFIGLLMAGVLVFGLLVAMVLSFKLLRIISDPISELSQVARQITHEHKYHLRAAVKGQDELGLLASTFNDMIEQVAKRDAYLEEQVAARTIDLEQKTHDLLEAKEKAEAANRSKSQFLANMSHEIRTPMSAIISMTDLAIEAKEEQPKQRFLQTVKQSADSLLGILNDILDFSKIEAGQLQMDYRPFNLEHLLESILTTMAVQADAKRISLTSSKAEVVPASFVGDEFRLKQILINLVGNAIKFTQKGSVAVSVTVEENKKENGLVTLHFGVADTGIGIAADKIENIFNSFEQADNSYTREYGGTGLGLAISKQLVELMGGELQVESVPGRGSTFAFTVVLQPMEKVPNVFPAPKSCPENLPSLRVLVVDDNEINREVATMILESEHAVTAVENGMEALDMLSEKSFDIVFMDVQMPLMDGLTTSTIIRSVEAGKEVDFGLSETLLAGLQARLHDAHIPIIAMTAHAMAGDKELCLDAGMDHYITKPFKPQQLASVVQELLYKHDGSEAVSPAVHVKSKETAATQLATISAFLKEATNLSSEQIFQVVEAARASIVNNLEKLTKALEEKDYPTLGVAAHTLKGTLLQLGLFEVAETAEKIHQGVREEREIAYAELLERLEDDVKQLYLG